MRLATITGHATATVKHASFEGHRLLLAQPQTSEGKSEGSPQIVLDCLGAAIHQQVIITSDGAEARRLTGDPRSPGRWSVVGIVDPGQESMA